jgi:hypothetical protein
MFLICALHNKSQGIFLHRTIFDGKHRDVDVDFSSGQRCFLTEIIYLNGYPQPTVEKDGGAERANP